VTDHLSGITLVLGGAASGKSSYAEQLVTCSAKPRIYIATAQAFDAEMKAKIDTHQNMRGPDWTTIEAPVDLSAALATATQDDVVLIDCATLWLTNILLGEHDLLQAKKAFFSALQSCPAPVVVVSNEVGYGIVPENALSRKFRNAQGQLNQELAACANTVVAVMAGLPLHLKGAKA